MIYDGLLLLWYLLTEVLNYTLGYVVVFRTKFTKNKIKWIAVIFLVVTIHFLILRFWNSDATYGISMFTMVIVPLFLLDNFKWRTLFLYPFVAMGTSAIHVALTFVAAIIMGIPEYKIGEGRIGVNICQSIPIVIFLLVWLWQKITKKDEERIEITNSQYLVLFVLIFSMFFLLAPLQVLSEYSDIKYINEIGLSASSSCILLLTVVLWQIYSSNKTHHLEKQKLLIEKQMELQKQYYTKLIQQDKDIRKFKHDYNAHMNVLKEYSKELECEKIEKYLEEISESLSATTKNLHTGNPEVDAIINSMSNDIEGAEIDFTIKGSISQNTSILANDLCSLVYNLLKNAVEACQKIENKSDRKIILQVGMYNNALFLSIKNTVHENFEINDYAIETTKADVVNHGYGTKIVKDIVDKYYGFIEASCNKNWFNVEINI